MALTKAELISENVIGDIMNNVLESGTDISIIRNTQTNKLSVSAVNVSSIAETIAFSIALS